MIQCQWQIDLVMSIVLSHLGPRKYWTPGDIINDDPLCRKVMRTLKLNSEDAIDEVVDCLDDLGWVEGYEDSEWIYNGT